MSANSDADEHVMTREAKAIRNAQKITVCTQSFTLVLILLDKGGKGICRHWDLQL